MPAFDYSRLSLILLGNSSYTQKSGHFRRPLSFTTSQETPLITLIDNIYFFPISWRKFIVDTCRIQKSTDSNCHLLASFDELVETTISPILLSNVINRGMTYFLRITIRRRTALAYKKSCQCYHLYNIQIGSTYASVIDAITLMSPRRAKRNHGWPKSQRAGALMVPLL